MSKHTWKLYASDETGWDASNALSSIVEGTEQVGIDVWFHTAGVTFAGRGPIPEDPHIERRPCPECHTYEGSCDSCCGNGFILRWVSVPAVLVEEAVEGLRSIIRELEEPSLV